MVTPMSGGWWYRPGSVPGDSLLLPSTSHVWYQHQICLFNVQICVCKGLGFGCDLCIGLPLDAMQDNIQFCGEKCIYGKNICIWYFCVTNVAFGGTFMTRKYPGCSGLVGCGTVGSDATTVPLVAWPPGPSPRSAKDFYFDLTQGCLSEIYLYFPD